jgi:hypothetical protein
MIAGIDEGDTPELSATVVDMPLIFADVKRDVAHAQEK